MWFTEVLDCKSIKSLPAFHSLQFALESARSPLFCCCSITRRVMEEGGSVSWQCSCKMIHQLSAHPVVSQVDSEYKVRKTSELKCCVPSPWELNQKNFRTGESMLQKGGQKICVSVLPSTEKSHALVILLYGSVASGMIWQVIPAIQKAFCLS